MKLLFIIIFVKSNFVDSSLQIFRIAIRSGNLSWLFTVRIYRSYLPWKFATVIYRGFLPWRFSMAFYCGNSLQLFAVVICKGYLRSLLAVGILLRKVVRRVRVFLLFVFCFVSLFYLFFI